MDAEQKRKIQEGLQGLHLTSGVFLQVKNEDSGSEARVAANGVLQDSTKMIGAGKPNQDTAEQLDLFVEKHAGHWNNLACAWLWVWYEHGDLLSDGLLSTVESCFEEARDAATTNFNLAKRDARQNSDILYRIKRWLAAEDSEVQQPVDSVRGEGETSDKTDFES